MKNNWHILIICALGFGTSYLTAVTEPGDRFYSLLDPALRIVDTLSLNEANAEPVEQPADIVSLGGSITETIVALGKGERIVAVDTTSVFPADVVAELPKVGYVRQLSSEGILSLAPKIIIATSDAGPKIAIEQIQNAGVPVHTIEKGHSVAATKEAVLSLGKLLDEEAKAKGLVATIDAKLTEARKLSEKFPKKPRVLFIYARGSRVLNVSGKNTSAHSMIELAGGTNAFENVEGYKPLTAESVVAAQPDAILMLSRGVDSLGGDSKVLELPGLKLTPAGKNNRVIIMDDLKLLGFGPRLGDAVLELTQAFKNDDNTAVAGRR